MLSSLFWNDKIAILKHGCIDKGIAYGAAALPNGPFPVIILW